MAQSADCAGEPALFIDGKFASAGYRVRKNPRITAPQDQNLNERGPHGLKEIPPIRPKTAPLRRGNGAITPLFRKSPFRDGFAPDCLLQRGVCKTSVPRGTRISEVGGAQDGDENLRRSDLAGKPVDDSALARFSRPRDSAGVPSPTRAKYPGGTEIKS
jgi:hypothetical protein